MLRYKYALFYALATKPSSSEFPTQSEVSFNQGGLSAGVVVAIVLVFLVILLVAALVASTLLIVSRRRKRNVSTSKTRNDVTNPIYSGE